VNKTPGEEDMRFTQIVFGLVLFGATNAFAQDNLKIGIGAISCANYIRIATSNSEETKLIAVSWVQGYLAGMNTAQNALAPDRGARVIPDSDALQAHMLLYCKQDQSNKLIRGATELFTVLPVSNR
jgi:hypothetical protein